MKFTIPSCLRLLTPAEVEERDGEEDRNDQIGEIEANFNERNVQVSL